jgi:hypothetical protein
MSIVSYSSPFSSSAIITRMQKGHQALVSRTCACKPPVGWRPQRRPAGVALDEHQHPATRRRENAHQEDVLLGVAEALWCGGQHRGECTGGRDPWPQDVGAERVMGRRSCLEAPFCSLDTQLLHCGRRPQHMPMRRRTPLRLQTRLAEASSPAVRALMRCVAARWQHESDRSRLFNEMKESKSTSKSGK